MVPALFEAIGGQRKLEQGDIKVTKIAAIFSVKEQSEATMADGQHKEGHGVKNTRNGRTIRELEALRLCAGKRQLTP